MRPTNTHHLACPNLATAGPAKQPQHAAASRLPPSPPLQTSLREPPACAATHRALTADGQAARLSVGAGCLGQPPQVLAMRQPEHKAFTADPLRQPKNTTQFHRWQLTTATITNEPSRTACLHRHRPCADCRRTGSPLERLHRLPSHTTSVSSDGDRRTLSRAVTSERLKHWREKPNVQLSGDPMAPPMLE